MYAPVIIQPINIPELTEVKLDGAGVLDVLLRTMDINIASQYDQGRIDGPEYARVYVDLYTATLNASVNGVSLQPNTALFVQTPELTAKGIAVNDYGALIIPASAKTEEITLKATVNGTLYTAKPISTEEVTINASSAVGTTVNMAKG